MTETRKKAAPARAQRRPEREEERPATWTFLSNHTHVLLCLAAEPELTLREVALRVGITERSVQRIIADLEADGYIERAREGARNRYVIHTDLPLRHPVEEHRRIGDLITMVLGKAATRPR